MQNENSYFTVCSLVSRLGKQAVSSGAIKKWPVEIALSFLGVCFLRQKVSTPKNFSLLLFLKMDKYCTLLKIKLILSPGTHNVCLG